MAQLWACLSRWLRARAALTRRAFGACLMRPYTCPTPALRKRGIRTKGQKNFFNFRAWPAPSFLGVVARHAFDFVF